MRGLSVHPNGQWLLQWKSRLARLPAIPDRHCAGDRGGFVFGLKIPA
jgi:hypothetical protein